MKTIFNRIVNSNILLLVICILIAVAFSELLIYLQLNIFWQEEENHKVVYYIGFWTSLTVSFFVVAFAILIRTIYEKDLKQKNDELDSYFNVMSDGLAIVDVKTKRFVNCNKAFEKLTGYAKDELIKFTIDKIHPQESLEYVIEQFEKHSKNEIFIALSIPVLHKNGKVTICDVNAKHYASDRQILNIGVFRDTTSRLVLEKKLHYLNENLEEKVKEELEKNRQQQLLILRQSRLAQMGEMISMIAHQWRQPLAAISATSASIELKAGLNKLDNDEAQKKAHDISSFSQHLSRTIDDFRDFFKPNKEKKEMTYDEIVKSVLRIMEVSISNKNIQLLQNLNCHETFNTYPNELKQVVLNLIKNAEEALLEKAVKDPTITIATYTKEDTYILEVSDNAGGISKDIINKIFDPYFSTKTKKDGTGLGLYMSKTIIEEHCGGTLSAINTGNGALFKIVLNKTND